MRDDERTGDRVIYCAPEGGDRAATPAAAKRGFAAMDSSRQSEIASNGGRAAHQKGTAHQFSSDEAREAGRLGGRTVSRDREHMAEIGRAGGKARGHTNGSVPLEEAPLVSPAATEVATPKHE
jgi:general stress protein YciG